MAQEIDAPRIALDGVPFSITIQDHDFQAGDTATLRAGDQTYEVEATEDEEITVEGILIEGATTLTLVDAGGQTLAEAEVDTIPGWFAILPSLIAIVLALALRQVIPAMFLGIWLGAALVYGSVVGVWYGLLDIITTYALDALTDSGHGSIIIFSLMIGGMVGIISKNGGTRGIVNLITKQANTPRHGQTATGILGIAIFFDDYANTLIVGNTMRPVTDSLRISREKLAYIVDSTAAPVATLALVSTWIGFQVGVLDGAVQQIEGLDESAYSIFLHALPYDFYPVLALVLVFVIAWSGRDFGPMLHAERRARTTGKVFRDGAHTGESPSETAEREPKPHMPQRAMNALIPILVLVVFTLGGIYVTGRDASEPGAPLRDIIGNGDSYSAMMWASLVAVLVAGTLSLTQRILSLGELVDAWYAGIRSMILAVIILLLAWSLANVNDVLHTGDFLVSTLGERLSPELLPALVFVLSALTAFATGSSWGVMGIVMPLAVPLSWAVLEANGMATPEHMHLLYSATAAVLAGAVWGDHCSPISDTTILSSLASGCDHIDHVRTQIPYAGLAGIVALVAGTLLVAYVYPWWVGMLVGVATLVGFVWFFGGTAGAHATPAMPEAPPQAAE
ncbi:MAG TPA: Na+/H+ antiporter NhaC family protein [Geminicoccaceae bacterium]